MPKEADFYTPSEAANMLGLTEFTVLGLLTSGQLQGHQEEAERIWEELEAERSKGFWRRLFGG